MFLFRYSTKQVVGISTVSRKQHPIAQTRELACTREVLPQVIDRGEKAGASIAV